MVDDLNKNGEHRPYMMVEINGNIMAQEKCCTPEGRIKRYVDCIGCDRKPDNRITMTQEIKITQTSNADMNIGVPKNLTAVEWLYQKMFEYQGRITKEDYEQAKEMEKEQILRSFSVGNDCGYCFAKKEDSQQYNSAKQYYNETFGGL
jgi:hypothetical protein